MPAPQNGVTTETWKSILASAVGIFDDLERRNIGAPGVVLGGGTVLMFRMQHRLSKDIDFFVRDVQWLTFLTPRLNDLTASLATDYQEQANSVKLILPHGDIDFIAAASVTNAPATEWIDFMGRRFPLEATEEILAKKLLYRAEYFKPRDVFDLVAVAETDPASAERALLAAASKRQALSRRLDQLDRLPLDQLTQDIVAIGNFTDIFAGMVETARRLLR